MVMPERKFPQQGKHRYGFNGKENDNEVKGDENQQDYGMRIYDPRICKFLSIDPITDEYPELTPYQFASNSPIGNIDLDGLEAYSKNPTTGELLTGPLDLNAQIKKGNIVGTYASLRAPSPANQKVPVVGTVRESVAQEMSSRNQQIAMKTSPNVPRRIATISQSRGFVKSGTGINEKPEKVDPYVGIIKKETQIRESSKPGDVVPIVGSFVQSARRFGNDDYSGGTRSALRGSIETAITFLPYLRAPSSLDPTDVHFMQSSISNTTGQYTVLGNAEALAAGTLNPKVLGITVWRDATGKIWTLDHRRLAAFRIAGLDKVPVTWASSGQVQSQMWKMTTTNGGQSIKLKLGDGTSTIVY